MKGEGCGKAVQIDQTIGRLTHNNRVKKFVEGIRRRQNSLLFHTRTSPTPHTIHTGTNAIGVHCVASYRSPHFVERAAELSVVKLLVVPSSLHALSPLLCVA
jgi:hypothetical protein